MHCLTVYLSGLNNLTYKQKVCKTTARNPLPNGGFFTSIYLSLV